MSSDVEKRRVKKAGGDGRSTQTASAIRPVETATRASAPPALRLPDPTRVPSDTKRVRRSKDDKAKNRDSQQGPSAYAKSGKTRLRILDAAIECLAVLGHAGTTVSSVAERAGLTRPAMQYHFSSRMSLMEAVIHHVMHCRWKNILTELPKVKQGQYASITHLAWEQTQTNLFRAFTELLIASRTDADLSAVFSPAFAEYDRIRREIATTTFPEQYLHTPWFDLSRDVYRFLLEGFAIQGGLSFDSERRKNDLLMFLRALGTEEGEALFRRAFDEARKPDGWKGGT